MSVGSAASSAGIEGDGAEEPHPRADVDHVLVTAQRHEGGGERELEAGHPLHELLALDDVEVGHGRCGGGRVTGVRVAVPPQEAGVVPERLGDGSGHEHGPHRQVARGQSLGGEHQVGLEPLGREHPSGASVPGDDLVGDEQHSAVAADRAHRLEVARRRRVHAARSDHRLAEEGRDAAAAQLVDERGERIGVVPRDVGDVGIERAVAVAVRGDAGQRRAREVHAVVRARARDDRRALRLAEEVPVAADDLHGRVDRVAATAGEEDLRVLHRREGGEPIGEVERGPRRQVAEVRVRRDARHLLHDRVGDLAPPVPDVAVPQARRGVEELAAVLGR